MHSSVTPHIRDLIKFRYRLLPYLYDLSYRHTAHYEPIIRPTFFDFPDDPRCLEDTDDMLLGPALLVAPVVESGATARAVYLPSGTRWFDWWTGEAFAGGQTVTRPAPYERPPLFAREGSIVALNIAEQHFGDRADTRAFAIFPLTEGTFSAAIFDDDGESNLAAEPPLWRIEVTCTPAEVTVAVTAPKGATADAEIILRANEKRSVTITGGAAQSSR